MIVKLKELWKTGGFRCDIIYSQAQHEVQNQVNRNLMKIKIILKDKVQSKILFLITWTEIRLKIRPKIFVGPMKPFFQARPIANATKYGAYKSKYHKKEWKETKRQTKQMVRTKYIQSLPKRLIQ